RRERLAVPGRPADPPLLLVSRPLFRGPEGTEKTPRSGAGRLLWPLLQSLLQRSQHARSLTSRRRRHEQASARFRCRRGSLRCITTHETFEDYVIDQGSLPGRRRGKCFDGLVHGGNRVLFDRPPEQERDMGILFVLVAREKACNNGKPVRGRQALRGGSELTAHSWI